MGKILVVEAHRMLQQAITLALFPEHEVKFASAIPEPPELKDFDAVIADLESLGESDGGSESAIRAVQSWKVPTVWVQDSSHGPTPQRENLIPINTPIEKEILLSALAECLGIPAKEKRVDKVAGSSKTKDNRSGAVPATPDSEVIELLEVVREGAEPETRQAQEKK